MDDNTKYFEANKKLWNARVQPHLGSKMYDLEAFKKGKSSLNEIELNTLGDLSGQEILHLQCHFGQDTLSMSRAGAKKVVGVDISDVAIKTAKELSDELSIGAEFVCSNVLTLQKIGEFDLVFSTYGATPWLPDLHKWANVINENLKSGGSFYFCEFHPSVYILDFDSLEMKYDYFKTEEPIMELAEGTYADTKAAIKMKEYSWNHSIMEIMNPLLSVGLQLAHLKEYDWSPYNCFPNMLNFEPGKYRLNLPSAFPHLLEMVWKKP